VQFSGLVPSLDNVVASQAMKIHPAIAHAPHTPSVTPYKDYAIVMPLERSLYGNIIPVRGIQMEG
jgi:hypothetical protein